MAQTLPVSRHPASGPNDPDEAQYARWIGHAIEEARRCLETGDVPVGAVLVTGDGEVVGRGRNRRVADADPLAHAELVAIRDAASARGHYRFDDCLLVVTLEPCLMCAGAAMQARLPRIVFGAWDPKAGACGSAWDVTGDNPSPLRTSATGGIREVECAALLTDFFRERRSGRGRGATDATRPGPGGA